MIDEQRIGIFRLGANQELARFFNRKRLAQLQRAPHTRARAAKGSKKRIAAAQAADKMIEALIVVRTKSSFAAELFDDSVTFSSTT